MSMLRRRCCCGPTTQACCDPASGNCFDVDPQTCLDNGGIPMGHGTRCETTNCSGFCHDSHFFPCPQCPETFFLRITGLTVEFQGDIFCSIPLIEDTLNRDDARCCYVSLGFSCPGDIPCDESIGGGEICMRCVPSLGVWELSIRGECTGAGSGCGPTQFINAGSVWISYSSDGCPPTGRYALRETNPDGLCQSIISVASVEVL